MVTLEFEEQKYGQRILQGLFSYKKREDDEFKYPEFVVDDGKLADVRLKTSRRPSLDNARDLKALGRKVREFRQKDLLRVKQFPTGQLTNHGLEAYLDALQAQENFSPDLLVVDYPRLMRLDPRNLRLELGQAIIDLRGMGVERNMAVAVAAQGNREGGEVKEMRKKHIGEDYSILQTADVVMMYSQTQAEYELQLARLKIDKGRDDADRFSVLIAQSYSSGQFVLDSRRLDKDYWAVLEAKKGVEAVLEASDGD